MNKSHLYKLNTNAPYKVEIWRGTITAIVLLIIGICLFALSVIFFVLIYTEFWSDSLFTTLIPFGFGAVLLTIGTILKRKDNQIKAALDEAALNGYVTFGKIETIIKRGGYAPAGFAGKEYELHCSFIDESGQPRRGIYKGAFSFIEGTCQEGQEIAILFYKDKSFVLKRYELL